VCVGLKNSAAAKKKPAAKATAAAGFKVVDGTVVAERAHDAVDVDVAAEVERELGNEAFRDQVRWLEIWLVSGRVEPTGGGGLNSMGG